MMLHFLRGKTKLAVWPVSNCNAESNRQGYVNVLSQYIPVDIVSANGCDGKNSISLCSQAVIEKTCKFYFYFENAICKDYVTEKFLIFLIEILFLSFWEEGIILLLRLDILTSTHWITPRVSLPTICNF